MTLDSQLDYWNRIGPTKTFAHPLNLEKLGQWVSPDSRILDYGCGYGRALGFLQSNGYWNLVGMDPAPAMIERACADHPRIAFSALNDFRNTGLPAGSIDAVLLFAVLTSVPRNEDQIAIVAEITRVLRPGGLLYISDMLLQTDLRNIARYERDEKKYGIYGVFDLNDGVTVRHHERAWIDSLLRNYEILAFDEIEAQTMNSHSAIVFQWFGCRR